ncbi:MAG: cell wall hydrolase [Sphingomonas sp.]|uniref:cell wall hydrolase n=1 Tax=Sphingomonas sp. TaxID=28214 RepID=UPI0018259B15|nr:cell wall hydrolase [Sphingomonas sp.]MBA3666786.1 cell wall hydrolase [Sphingomonas sp.]
MNKFLKAGLAPVFAIVALFPLGGSSVALAQQVTTSLPLVQAVVRTVTTPIDAGTAAIGSVVTAPAAPIALSALVESNSMGAALDEESKCMATAVYFESMGEPLEGQLAVAEVVMNRARSGRYPASWCGVVKQKAQFSFVRAGRFPRIDPDCAAWHRAQAITRIAALHLTSKLSSDVLWYHADYVAPTWRRNLQRAEKIGAHVFYRS